jgi:hypothetical protein
MLSRQLSNKELRLHIGIGYSVSLGNPGLLKIIKMLNTRVSHDNIDATKFGLYVSQSLRDQR